MNKFSVFIFIHKRQNVIQIGKCKKITRKGNLIKKSGKRKVEFIGETNQKLGQKSFKFEYSYLVI